MKNKIIVARFLEVDTCPVSRYLLELLLVFEQFMEAQNT